MPELVASIAEARLSGSNQNERPRPSTKKIYVVYGAHSQIRVDKYCPRLNVWSEAKTLPLNIDRFTVIQHDGKLIVIGGKDAQNLYLDQVIVNRSKFSC